MNTPFPIKTTTLKIFFPFLARKLPSCFYSSLRTKLSARNKHITSELPSFTNSNQRQVKGTGTYAGTSSLNVADSWLPRSQGLSSYLGTRLDSWGQS